jgi:peptidoglycan/xylan/chitin deacetylase (PgdA/CDA1 family)
MVGQKAQAILAKLGGWPHASVSVGLFALLAWGYATPAPTKVDATPPPPRPAALQVPIDCSLVACMALTFDDGPDPVYTPQVLDILERNGAKATFFVLGNHVAGNEALLRRMHSAGHEIGNHTWGHPRLTRLSPEQIEAEINSTQAAVAAAGVPAPKLFRPPYADINPEVSAHIPLSIIRWNIDPEDWSPSKRKYLLEHLASHAKPGGVVILHDTEATTVPMLEPLIIQLKTQNYQLVTVSQLLNIAPGQPGTFFGR